MCVEYVGHMFCESGGNITSGCDDSIDVKDYAQIEHVSDLINSDVMGVRV
jgi:hypothetical protein